jgi:hypothetical protein
MEDKALSTRTISIGNDGIEAKKLEAEVLAEQDGLFVHHWFSPEDGYMEPDRFSVSAISCGYNVSGGGYFESLPSAIGYMKAIASITDWTKVTPETPIRPEWQAAAAVEKVRFGLILA